jgi:hypothetical protein
MTTETFDFLGSKGHYLSGRLERPETTTRGWAVLAHCSHAARTALPQPALHAHWP